MIILKELLSNEQLAFVQDKLSKYSTDTPIDLDDFAAELEDYYQLQSLDEDYVLTANGQVAESIIDFLVEKGLW